MCCVFVEWIVTHEDKCGRPRSNRGTGKGPQGLLVTEGSSVRSTTRGGMNSFVVGSWVVVDL